MHGRLAGTLLAATVSLGAWAGEGAAPGADEVTIRGRLSAKPNDAQDGVAALLTVVARKGERPEAPKTIYLFAKDDLATQLADLAKQKAKVQVTGRVRGDGMEVTKVVEKGVARKREAGAPPADDAAPADHDEDF